jgi:hypothetical protein
MAESEHNIDSYRKLRHSHIDLVNGLCIDPAIIHVSLRLPKSADFSGPGRLSGRNINSVNLRQGSSVSLRFRRINIDCQAGKAFAYHMRSSAFSN